MTTDAAMNGNGGISVVLTPEEFAEDMDVRLGRANGNIYHRRPGVAGVHDGQVMVRLKKKRFIIIDYSVAPTEADLQVASVSPHINCPPGAGRVKCTAPECNKVGVPCLLYDSDPNEAPSLYMRSGLCFMCQRNLNEKRRTQRKRPSDAGVAPTNSTSTVYAGPGQKKVKVGGEIINLNSDAIIINGACEGVRHHGDGYGFSEIGADLQRIANEAAADTDRLVTAVSNSTEPAISTVVGVSDAATAAAVAATTGLLPDAAANGDATAPASSKDINALYDKAFQSMNKTIFLLTQWKASWDAAIAAACAQETVGDHGLADAVASAAAVAAAASENQNPTNMASLLLAADQRKGDGKKSDVATEAVEAAEAAKKVESFEV